MRKKLSAFTLSEITVTLIIVLIVVAIAYQIIRNMNVGYTLFYKNETSSGLTLQSYSRIAKDIKKSTGIIKEGDRLFLFTQKHDTIIYLSMGDVLIRNYDNHYDTIFCTIKDYEFYPSSQNSITNLVKSIKISFNGYSEDNIILTKEYTPENLIRFLSLP